MAGVLRPLAGVEPWLELASLADLDAGGRIDMEGFLGPTGVREDEPVRFALRLLVLPAGALNVDVEPDSAAW